MRLDEAYLNRSYHDAMVSQYSDLLKSQGFSVELEKKIQYAENSFIADLFAIKNDETRLYEFKLVGNGKMPNTREEGSIRLFKEIAAALNAKPFVVYISPPGKKDITIEGLEEGLYAYIRDEPNLPSGLEGLFSNAEIVSVDVDRINNINISSRLVIVDGDATISLKLQPDDEADSLEQFPMIFKAEYIPTDNKLSFLKIQEYFIDASNW